MKKEGCTSMKYSPVDDYLPNSAWPSPAMPRSVFVGYACPLKCIVKICRLTVQPGS